MPLAVTVLTPEKTVLETDSVEYLVAPGLEGDVGVLPGHVSFVTSLQVGPVWVDDDPYAVSGGLLEVVNDRVKILAQTAEHRDKIDKARAKRARQRAEDRLRSKEAGIDMARVEAALARALNRLRVAHDETEGAKA